MPPLRPTGPLRGSYVLAIGCIEVFLVTLIRLWPRSNATAGLSLSRQPGHSHFNSIFPQVIFGERGVTSISRAHRRDETAKGLEGDAA